MRPIPQLVAHRGYAANYPENTLQSMVAALEAGACFLECDIQLSRDGVPMVHHDPDLKRSAGMEGVLSAISCVELQQICVSEPERFPGQFQDVTIASLQQLVLLLQQWPKAQLFVELKEESLEQFGISFMLERVMEVIQPVVERCIIISFHWQAMKELKERGGVRTGWVISEWSEAFQKKAEQLSPDFLFNNIDRFPVEGIWQGGWQWAIYEITDPEVALELAERGVALVESFAIGELLQHELLSQRRCHDPL